jgi:hypothetical protein
VPSIGHTKLNGKEDKPMLSQLLKAIRGAKSKTQAKSDASAARNAVRKNERMVGEKEQAAIDKINSTLKERIAAITESGKTSKASPEGVAGERAKTRAREESARTTQQKGSIATRTAASKTAIDEAKTLSDVSIARTKIQEMEDGDLRKFFLAELKDKENKIRNKQAGEASKVSRTLEQKQSDKKFKGYDPSKDLPFKRGGLVRTGHTDMRKGGLFYK